MSLNLDARQRAMLQDMGITVWAPRTALAPTLSAPAAPALSAAPEPAAADPVAPVTTAVSDPAPAIKRPTSEPNQPLTQVVPTQAAPDSEANSGATSHAALPAYRAPAAATAPWFMAPLVHAYADSAPATAPDAGWLIAVECADPHDPWAGEAGQLLNNMLRALRLQLHPQVRIAPLTRHAPAEGADSDLQALAPALQAAIGEHHPARVLVLGLHAARAVLQRTEALGPLRAELHHVHGVPTVVSYDPAYLLRAAHAKPGAWADLCRAHSLQPPAP